MADYHIFLSYARADNLSSIDIGGERKGWIDAFYAQIKARHRKYGREDLRIFFDKSEIVNGDIWEGKLREGVRNSRLFIAFLSPSYFRSANCRWEWEEYVRLEHNLARGQGGIKIVYLDKLPELDAPVSPAEAASWIEDIRKRQRDECLDFHLWRNDTSLLTQLLRPVEHASTAGASRILKQVDKLNAVIAERLSQAKLSAIAAEHGNVSGSYPTFVGRVDELQKLHVALSEDKVGLIGALHGLGGQGKTALAVQFAHAYAWKYAAGGRWQTPCEGVRAIGEVLDVLGLQLGYRLPDSLLRAPEALRTQAHLAEMRKCTFARAAAISADLAEGRTGVMNATAASADVPRRMLLILDNVDQPGILAEASLADLNAANSWLDIIVTTRLDPREVGSTSRLCPIPVDDLPADDALALLKHFRPFESAEEEAAAREIVALLGGMTVAVELVGAFLASPGAQTYRQMLKSMRIGGVPALDQLESQVSNEVRVSQRSRRVGWIVDDTLKTLVPAAILALHYATFFPSDRVNTDWLKSLIVRDFSDLDEDSSLKIARLGVSLQRGRKPEEKLGADIASKTPDARVHYRDEWAAIIASLNARRLLVHDAAYGSRNARLHRLVAEHIAASMSAEKRHEHRETILRYLRNTFGRLAVNHPVTPGPFEDMRSDVASLVEHLADSSVGLAVVGPMLTWLAADEARNGLMRRASTLHEKAVRALSVEAEREPPIRNAVELVAARLESSNAGEAHFLWAAALAAQVTFELRHGSVDLDDAIAALREKAKILGILSSGGVGELRYVEGVFNLNLALVDLLEKRGAEGDSDEALNLLQHCRFTAETAISLLEPTLPADNPKALHTFRLAFVAEQRLGHHHLHARKDPRAAMPCYEQCLKVATAVHGIIPYSFEGNDDVATALEGVADCESSMPERLKSYFECLRIREGLVREESTMLGAKSALAHVQMKTAAVCLAHAVPESLRRAVELLRASVSLRRELFEADPTLRAARDLMNALDLFIRAQSHPDVQDSAATLETCDEAIEAIDRLRRAGNGGFFEEKSFAHLKKGDFLATLGRMAEAHQQQYVAYIVLGELAAGREVTDSKLSEFVNDVLAPMFWHKLEVLESDLDPATVRPERVALALKDEGFVTHIRSGLAAQGIDYDRLPDHQRVHVANVMFSGTMGARRVPPREPSLTCDPLALGIDRDTFARALRRANIAAEGKPAALRGEVAAYMAAYSAKPAGIAALVEQII